MCAYVSRRENYYHGENVLCPCNLKPIFCRPGQTDTVRDSFLFLKTVNMWMSRIQEVCLLPWQKKHTPTGAGRIEIYRVPVG